MRKKGEVMKHLQNYKRRFMIANYIIANYQNKLAEKCKNAEITQTVAELKEAINEPLEKWHDIHKKDDYIIPLTNEAEIVKSLFDLDYNLISITPNCRFFKKIEYSKEAKTIIIQFTDEYFNLVKGGKNK